MSARARSVGLGPSSYGGQYQAPTGAGATSAYAGQTFVSAAGTPEGKALIVLVIVELIVTGWLRAIFKGVHGG